MLSEIKVELSVKSRKLCLPVELDDGGASVMEEVNHDPVLADQFIIQRQSTRATQYAAYSYISNVRNIKTKTNLFYLRIFSLSNLCRQKAFIVELLQKIL